MNKTELTQALEIMKERFGHDALISLATIDGNMPAVRTVDGYYEDGAFYTITYALSGKMKQIEVNPNVAICGDWFTGHGVGKNLGHIGDERNQEILSKLKEAFSTWYSNGHINESDPNTIILRISLTDGVLFNHGTRYDIDFNTI